MVFKITGTLKGKKYLSRKKFSSVKDALKWAYKNLVYTKNGETKKKYSLSNLSIIKV